MYRSATDYVAYTIKLNTYKNIFWTAWPILTIFAPKQPAKCFLHNWPQNKMAAGNKMVALDLDICLCHIFRTAWQIFTIFVLKLPAKYHDYLELHETRWRRKTGWPSASPLRPISFDPLDRFWQFLYQNDLLNVSRLTNPRTRWW